MLTPQEFSKGLEILDETIRGIERGTVVFYYHNVTPPELWGTEVGSEAWTARLAAIEKAGRTAMGFRLEGGRNRPACPRCGFVQYLNPAPGAAARGHEPARGGSRPAPA